MTCIYLIFGGCTVTSHNLTQNHFILAQTKNTKKKKEQNHPHQRLRVISFFFKSHQLSSFSSIFYCSHHQTHQTIHNFPRFFPCHHKPHFEAHKRLITYLITFSFLVLLRRSFVIHSGHRITWKQTQRHKSNPWKRSTTYLERTLWTANTPKKFTFYELSIAHFLHHQHKPKNKHKHGSNRKKQSTTYLKVLSHRTVRKQTRQIIRTFK